MSSSWKILLSIYGVVAVVCGGSIGYFASMEKSSNDRRFVSELTLSDLAVYSEEPCMRMYALSATPQCYDEPFLTQHSISSFVYRKKNE